MTNIAMERSTLLLIGKPSISMGHLYHGYVSHNQRVLLMNHFPKLCWIKLLINGYTNNINVIPPKFRVKSLFLTPKKHLLRRTTLRQLGRWVTGTRVGLERAKNWGLERKKDRLQKTDPLSLGALTTATTATATASTHIWSVKELAT